jgi:hypothetical protein
VPTPLDDRCWRYAAAGSMWRGAVAATVFCPLGALAIYRFPAAWGARGPGGLGLPSRPALSTRVTLEYAGACVPPATVGANAGRAQGGPMSFPGNVNLGPLRATSAMGLCGSSWCRRSGGSGFSGGSRSWRASISARGEAPRAWQNGARIDRTTPPEVTNLLAAPWARGRPVARRGRRPKACLGGEG